MSPTPHRCSDCGDMFMPGVPHQCDVDKKFVHQERLRRQAELDAELAQAQDELRPEQVALTLARWQQNATCQPCPDADHANVSLPRLREFADWQREHENEET